MPRLIFILFSLLVSISSTAQEQADSLFRVHLENDEYQVWMDLNLYDNDIVVPGQDILGALVVAEADVTELDVGTLDGQRAPEPPVAAAWVPIIIVIPQFVLYVTHGDIVLNVIDCSLMAAIGFFTVRGILTPYKEGLAGNRAFHVSVFIWGLLQLTVWTASCFSTPVFSMLYTVSDFLLTVSYAGILVCAWRVRP